MEAAVIDAKTQDSIVVDSLAYHFGFDPYGPARTGKRLRPRMVALSAEAFGAQSSLWLPAATGIELLHNYSLIHDDIEDQDELRHGRPTLWKRIGIAQALNAGDALCALSFLALMRVDKRIHSEVALSMVRRLHRAHRIMCDGQALDIGFERERHVDVPRYRAMIGYKTAALFATSAELGVMAARNRDENDSDVRAYYDAGFAYGMAFQLRDDLLGIWADADTTGKAVAHDLARRKWSYPVVWALAQDPSAARAVVEDAYGKMRPLDAGDVERVVSALDTMGARDALEAEILAQTQAVAGFAADAMAAFADETLTSRP